MNPNNKKITIKSTHKIFDFLNKHQVKKGEKFTHNSMGKPLGSFYIPSSEEDEFFKLYLDAINNNIQLHLLERHNEYSPILIDFDFKYDFSIMERQHNINHIKKIIKLYIEEINNIFNISNKKEKLIAFVFERENPYKYKGNTKDGIHIIFPYIVSESNPQYLLRENVLKKINKIIEDLPLKNTNSDIVDRSVISKNGWLLFNSTKPNCKRYNLTHIFDCHGEKIEIDEVNYNGINNPAKFFSIRRNTIKDVIPIRNERIADIEKMGKKKNKYRTVKRVNYDFDTVKQLVNILSEERANDFNKWIEVGICLNSIDPNNSELYDLWNLFSQKSDKYDEDSCEKKWIEIEKSNKNRRELTIATLIFWAKIDNYEKFLEIKRKEIQYYIEKSITCTNYDIARVLYELYKYQFIYCDKEWYEFKNHRWILDNEGISLRSKISTQLVIEYIKLIEAYNQEAIEEEPSEENDEKVDDICKKTKLLSEITKKLKTTSFKNDIMKESKELFHDNELIKKLDENPYLIGFENGIYDLQKMEFRDGLPDDFVSISTGNDYIDYEEENEYIEDINKFLSTVFPNEEIREYVLIMLSSYLQGVNAEEKFRIWTGVGSNGKSKLEELFLLAFGDYCIKFPITLLTGKRAASNACTPEIVQSKGKRFGYFEEPSENEKINVGLMKEFTGGDKIKARGLHKAPIEFKPQFKLCLLCNSLPAVPPNDEGTWRRLEVIEFTSKFVDKPKEINEYPRDQYLSEKLKIWKEVFISWLIEVYYKKYKKEGIKVPNEVLKFTNNYQKNCDVFIEFLEDNVEEGTKKDEISFTELHEEYKIWYSDNYNSNKFATKRDFKKYMTKRYKNDCSTKSLIGYRLKNNYSAMPVASVCDDNVSVSIF